MSTRFDHCRCLVTGASSGLGYALAGALARAGARVVATGRDGERLEAWRSSMRGEGVAPERIEIVAADLTRPGSIGALRDAVAACFEGALDLLVQSAGVGAYGRFLSHEADVLRRVFEINVLAVADLARACHPLLVRGANPAMVVMGSVVGRRGLPGRTEYSASKFALTGFVEGLRAEWSYDGVHVMLVNPGFTRTAFDEHLVANTAFLTMPRARAQTADDVARATLRALGRRKNEITPAALRERLLLLVNRAAPRFVDWGLGRWTRKLYARHLASERRSGA